MCVCVYDGHCTDIQIMPDMLFALATRQISDHTRRRARAPPAQTARPAW